MALIEHILRAYDAGDADRPHVLGTVVDLQGSGYRRPGARILIQPDGQYVGAISGGCLEKDAARHAREWVSDGPTTVLFDTRAHELRPLGEYGTGCDGIVHLFLQEVPVQDGGLDALASIRSLRESGRSAAMVTAYDASSAYQGPLGTLALVSDTDIRWAQTCPESLRPQIEAAARETLESEKTRGVHLASHPSGVRLLIEYVRPRVELVVVGTGRDAAALVQVASSMDWRIRVVGNDPMALSRPAFASVETTYVDGPEADAPTIGEHSYVVQMTHDFELDARFLPLWLSQKPAYLGLLGPRRRTARLVSELHVHGALPAEDVDAALETLTTPVGLDLGGEDPYEVALSILAEIVAAKNGRSGGPLSARSGPIHTPHEVLTQRDETGGDSVNAHAIILAAGDSTRMGEPKALLELDGETLIRRAIRHCRAAGATPLAVLGAHARRIETHLDDTPFVVNAHWRDGMSSSLALGIQSLPAGADRALILAIDQPDVEADLLRALLEACDSDVDAAATEYESGLVGVPACFDASVFDRLTEGSGDRGARYLLRSGQLRVASVPGHRRGLDVDTPQQWADYLAARTDRGDA